MEGARSPAGSSGLPQPRLRLRPLDSRVAGRRVQEGAVGSPPQLREVSLAVRVQRCDGNEGKIASPSPGLWGLRTSRCG